MAELENSLALKRREKWQIWRKNFNNSIRVTRFDVQKVHNFSYLDKIIAQMQYTAAAAGDS